MGIVYCEADRTFTIQTKNTTYQMQVDRFGFLLHLYYGKKTDGSCMDYLLTYYDRGFSGNPYDAGSDRTYSMDALPQEYPCYGTGDYRSVAVIFDTVHIRFLMGNIRFRDFRQSMRKRQKVRHLRLQWKMWLQE